MNMKSIVIFILLISLILTGCENINDDSIYLKLAIYPAGFGINSPSDAFRVFDQYTIIISINNDGNYNIKDGLDREKTKKLDDSEIEEVKEAIRVLNKVSLNKNIWATDGCEIAFETKKRFDTFNDFIIHHYDENDYNKELAEAINTILKLSPIEIKPRCQ